MSTEGELHLRLAVRSGAVAAVDVESTRRTDVARVFIGMEAESALRVVPSLFAVCGAAHLAAARAACEAACGIETPAAAVEERALQCALEAVGNEIFQICTVWPQLLASPPSVELVRATRVALAALRTAGTVAALAALKEVSLQLAPADEIADEASLQAWVTRSTSPSARLLAAVRDNGAENFGSSSVPTLPSLPASWYSAHAARPAFSRYPTLDGHCAEASCLSVAATHPAVLAQLRIRGPTLWTRLVAHLAAVQVWMHRIEVGVGRRTVLPDREGLRLASGRGAGVADTARGRLAHLVELENGRVAGWWSIAPTEWTFHPHGTVQQALLGAPAAHLAQRASWVVAALDPCVSCGVTIEEALDA